MVTAPIQASEREDAVLTSQGSLPAIEAELNAGLSTLQATVSPKYLYDALGSRLFTAICELQEYYPTRTEAAVFNACSDEIAASVGRGMTLIDLGAGDCSKAERLFSSFQPRQYVAVDISEDFLKESLGRLRERFKRTDMLGLSMDFSRTLELPDSVHCNKRLFFYPGSSIGNFSPREATAFLQRLRKACECGGRSEGGLLIGVDLVKDEAILNAAYDDELGVTAAFNLNLLRHLNRLLGADFRTEDWKHKAFFNAQESRIEMHLVAQSNVTVRWRSGRRRFEKGESIHTENSYKYTQKGFLSLLEQAGFGNARIWTDPQKWFMVCHADAV
ncbi:L-histidine N(alpha)-methyltransferase [Oxalobacteraceae bacterium R-40]|uniref:L-histidine N(Alpha)-methyltransferase n=1 Tax=Keguizhuia sedimenti TaxID=3064264 RepID=A0ABU1BR72_9BURK|nr:L-histidine N(alpha)-methyltransferase [Oxalobacteraceae bacterium R-40]